MALGILGVLAVLLLGPVLLGFVISGILILGTGMARAARSRRPVLASPRVAAATRQ